MLKLVNDNNQLMNYLMENPGVNYFIMLSLEREKYEPIYVKKWVQLNSKDEVSAILVKRKSGNVQFYSKGSYDPGEIVSLLNVEGFNKIFAEISIFEQLEKCLTFTKIEEGSYVSVLKKNSLAMVNNLKNSSLNYNIRKMLLHDLDEVIDLYSQVFKGFATKQSMVDKLINSYGRGYCAVINNKIISVAQSSFEKENSAVISGVATLPKYRKLGVGSNLTLKLCSELLEKGKDCFLQYDNEIAGRIYNHIGFKQTGRMITCFR